MLLVDLAPIRGTDDTLNTLVFIRCRHPLALEMIPSNLKCENPTVKLESCCCNAKLICNGHGVCGTYVPRHCSPIVVWTHSNDCVAIHTHVGYEMGRYTS